MAFLIPSVNLWNIDSGKYSTCLVLFEYLHFILDLEARFSHSYSNWGGGKQQLSVKIKDSAAQRTVLPS